MAAPENAWKRAAESFFLQDPRMTPAGVLIQLGETARREGLSVKLPSLRSVSRWKRDYDPAQHFGELPARWPESFESGQLHWDAAPLLAEWLRVRGGRRSPSVNSVRWYARLVRSAPGADHARLRLQARRLAALEVTGPIPDEVARELETRIVKEDWPTELAVPIAAGTSVDDAIRVLLELSGVELGEAARSVRRWQEGPRSGSEVALRIPIEAELPLDDPPESAQGVPSGPEEEARWRDEDAAAARYRADRLKEINDAQG